MKTNDVLFTVLLASLMLVWLDSWPYITRLEVGLNQRVIIVASGNGGMAFAIAGASIPEQHFRMTRTATVRTKGSMIIREAEHPDILYLPLITLIAGGWFCWHLWHQLRKRHRKKHSRSTNR